MNGARQQHRAAVGADLTGGGGHARVLVHLDVLVVPGALALVRRTPGGGQRRSDEAAVERVLVEQRRHRAPRLPKRREQQVGDRRLARARSTGHHPDRGAFARTGGSGHHESVTSGPGRGRQPARDRPPRLRPLAAKLVEDVAAVEAGTPDSELLDRLEAALAQLPSAERAAVMTTYGYARVRRRSAPTWASPTWRPRRSRATPCSCCGPRSPTPNPTNAAAIHASRSAIAAKPRRPRTRSGALCHRPARSPHGVRWLEATCLGPGAIDRIGKLLWCRDKATQS